MIGFFRLVGVLNAALWFGATVFFTFFVGPAFFSEPMVKTLTPPYAGFAAQVVLERYFALHLICGLIGLAHLVAESLYLGRPFLRWTLSLLAAIFILGLLGGYGLQPKLKVLHRTMYFGLPAEVREPARKQFRVWHGVSQGLNLMVLVGVTAYLLRVSRSGDGSRYRS